MRSQLPGRALLTFLAAAMVWSIMPGMWAYCASTGREGFSAGWATDHPVEVGVSIDAKPRAQLVYLYLPLAREDYPWVKLRSFDIGLFNAKVFDLPTGRRATIFAMPIWSTSVLTLPLPIAAFASYRRHRRLAIRQRDNRCLACGYDLRGSDGRCPECGVDPRPLPF